MMKGTPSIVPAWARFDVADGDDRDARDRDEEDLHRD